MTNKIAYLSEKLKDKDIEHQVLNFSSSNHLLINGDCEKIINLIPDESVDLVITDPPYNQGLNYGRNFNDKKSWKDYYNWLFQKLSGLPRIIKPTGSFYLISYPEINARILPFLEDKMKLKFRRWITWHYPTNIGHSKRNFTRSQRSVLFFTKTDNYIFNRENLLQHYKNPTASVVRERILKGSKGRTSYDLLRFMDIIELQNGLVDVLDINLLKNNAHDRMRNIKEKFHPLSKDELKKCDHPCQLPVALLELFIKVSSNNDSIVLDPFSGTFTTSVAAKRNERSSIGIELNKKYIKFGKDRLINDSKLLI